MDLFLRTENTTVFKEWVLIQKVEGLTIQQDAARPHIISIDGQCAHGEIRFNDLDIIEMEVTNNYGDNIFYLHFQMGNYNHALSLYQEMIETMLKTNEHTHIKVLLSCTGGLTTSLFAMQLNDGAKMLGLDYEFEAVAFTQLYKIGKHHDIILLAPQIAYKKPEVEKVFPKLIVEAIPGAVFASYNVAEAFNLIKDKLAQKEVQSEPADITLKQSLTNPTKLLSIGIIRHYDEVRIAYRVYDHNDIVLEQKVVKFRFSVEDLQDVIDAMMAQYPNIEVIGISTPMFMNDIVMMPLEDATDQEFLDYLKERYPNIAFYWFNDADALSVGYYMSQDKYQSLAFMFLPRLNAVGGVGSIFNGQLVVGRLGQAGEVHYCVTPQLKDDIERLRQTPEGATLIVARSIIPVIAVLAPEAIVINCVMMPDTVLLKTMLLEYFPEKYIPDLIKVTHLQQYILLGTMAATLIAHQKS